MAAGARGDRFLLVQALGNLVQNALEFAPAGGTVSISLTEGSGGFALGVEDTGPGVPEYALEKVFDRFYSLPRPGATRKSTGLGLALVREIAHLHGGDAALANRPDGGARATVWLPGSTTGAAVQPAGRSLAVSLIGPAKPSLRTA